MLIGIIIAALAGCAVGYFAFKKEDAVIETEVAKVQTAEAAVKADVTAAADDAKKVV
jgi:hypothetical protein